MEDFPLSKTDLEKCISAFRDDNKTLLSLIVVRQVFLAMNINLFKGETAYEFSERLADKFLDKLNWGTEGQSDDDLKMAVHGYYNIIWGYIELSLLP
ncbi:MAG: hypothetical protein JSS76_13015 [Bacteroidetes bacterium]|nr:hypothetical protein [Bacteroidota bacterium]